MLLRVLSSNSQNKEDEMIKSIDVREIVEDHMSGPRTEKTVSEACDRINELIPPGETVILVGPKRRTSLTDKLTPAGLALLEGHGGM